jgi:hypothetical protein
LVEFGKLKNCNDLIGNRTRDLPACSVAPQPTTLPRASVHWTEIHLTSLVQLLVTCGKMFIYTLLNDAVGSSDYIVSNGRITNVKEVRMG